MRAGRACHRMKREAGRPCCAACVIRRLLRTQLPSGMRTASATAPAAAALAPHSTSLPGEVLPGNSPRATAAAAVAASAAAAFAAAASAPIGALMASAGGGGGGGMGVTAAAPPSFDASHGVGGHALGVAGVAAAPYGGGVMAGGHRPLSPRHLETVRLCGVAVPPKQHAQPVDWRSLHNVQ